MDGWWSRREDLLGQQNESAGRWEAGVTAAPARKKKKSGAYLLDGYFWIWSVASADGKMMVEVDV